LAAAASDVKKSLTCCSRLTTVPSAWSPLDPFPEVELLLARHQQPAEKVDLSVTDILIRDAGRLRLRA